MSSPSPDRETLDDIGMPRWAKVLGVVAVVVIVILVAMVFAGGHGGHGLGRHFG